MELGERHSLLTSTLVTSAGTLTSRVLGLVRDTVTAALFGLAAGGVLDALVMAFRIPNLFRALFGEGAMTASYLPVFTEALHEDRRGAWRLFWVTMRWLAIVLMAVTFLGEVVIGVWAVLARADAQVLMLAGLAAVLLPYLIFICLAAMAAATLQSLGRFALAAFAPLVLNVCWIIGAAVVAPRMGSTEAQAYALAVCILAGGLLQWIVLWPGLRREWLRMRAESAAATSQPVIAVEDAGVTQQRLRRIQRGMIPTTLALTVTQLNTLSDSVVAWILAAPDTGSQTISWLRGVHYPMQQGAVSAIYFGERVYQFPLGLIGIAAATVIFPLLSRHAARGDRAAVGKDLTLGLRMVLLVAVPCAVGLVILSEPIARLLFEHGRFTDADAARAGRMIAVYGAAVWAYCSLPVLVRGFYAMDDRITPLRVAVSVVALNLLLDFTLIWPLAEAGLAASTAISAVVQVAALGLLFSKRHVRIGWRQLGMTAVRAVVASTVMGAICLAVLSGIKTQDNTWNDLLRVMLPMGAGAAAYFGILAIVGRADWRDLRRQERAHNE